MKLGEVLVLNHSEFKTAIERTLTEGPLGAPRWNFNYGNANTDPTPDALVLGTYQNPGSGNELVGGINLHYLERDQLDELRKALPTIMRGGNLKQRYRIGSQLLPKIFDNFYRTYRSDYINAIQPSELPYWQDDDKTKTKRKKDMDVLAAQRRKQELRKQALSAAQQRPTQEPGIPVTATGMPPVGRQKVGPQEPIARQDQFASINQQQKRGEAELRKLADLQKQRAKNLSIIKGKADAIKRSKDANDRLERERQKNLSQLEVSGHNGDEEDPLAVTGESFTYWSPLHGRYIVEMLKS